MPQYMPLRHLISSALGFAPNVRVWEQKISGLVWSFSGLRTRKFSFSGALVVLGNFNGNVPVAKLLKKAKDWTFKHYLYLYPALTCDPCKYGQPMYLKHFPSDVSITPVVSTLMSQYIC